MQIPTPAALDRVTVILEGHTLERLRQYRDLQRAWLDAEDGSAQSLALREQLNDVRSHLAAWLDVAVEMQEKGAQG
ncbi:hypothetical protein A7318_28005 (plasmid) [Pseudomonas lurida]|uniref:hypothetical protein n=1 Tax=Pseudomonas lurida TaxID=244566 RepID=UPI00083DD5E0|nr:hypothetical protein [Pseudomonas lurida]AOE82490.1 hypothetical protein A7318_28005 [Pseudomonas lurida]